MQINYACTNKIQGEHNGSHIPSYNVTIDGLTIEKYQTMGVRIANAHDVVVQNSIFENATDIGGGGVEE